MFRDSRGSTRATLKDEGPARHVEGICSETFVGLKITFLENGVRKSISPFSFQATISCRRRGRIIVRVNGGDKTSFGSQAIAKIYATISQRYLYNRILTGLCRVHLQAES